MTLLSSKKRILYFCSRLPSNVQGGLDLRVRGQISAMLSFAEVSVFALNGHGQPFDSRINSWRSSKNASVSRGIDALAVMASLREGGNPFESRFSEETVTELRNEIYLHSPDLIVLSHIDLTVYLSAIKEKFFGEIILDLDESITSTSPTILKLMKHPGQKVVFKAFCNRVELIEKEVLSVVDQIWVSSELERKKLLAHYGVLNQKFSIISVMPNCISVEAYTSTEIHLRNKDTIIFPASFAYEPNLDASRFLISELMPILPEKKLKFVGSHLPTWMIESQTENISCEGPVKDIAPFLQAANVLVVPLRGGGGTRLKVIEALAAGLPIVSTGFGVEGLDLIPMKDYLHAESAIEFATQIHKITSNNELAIDLSERGKATAKNRFSIEFLEGLIRSVIVK